MLLMAVVTPSSCIASSAVWIVYVKTQLTARIRSPKSPAFSCMLLKMNQPESREDKKMVKSRISGGLLQSFSELPGTDTGQPQPHLGMNEYRGREKTKRQIYS